MKYIIEKDDFGRDVLIGQDDEGKLWSIPMNESNSDYQAYLESLKDAAN